MRPDDEPEPEFPPEIAFIGDVSENESDLSERLLDVPIGGPCVLYFDSPGGSAYSAISLLSLMTARKIDATGVVTGECSSAALWPFAACRRRIVTPFSVLLFHPMKWESEEQVRVVEATEWVRHFGDLEREMDRLLANYLKMPYEKIADWVHPGRYVTGQEFAAAGLAELVELPDLAAHLDRIRDEAQQANRRTRKNARRSRP